MLILNLKAAVEDKHDYADDNSSALALKPNEMRNFTLKWKLYHMCGKKVAIPWTADGFRELQQRNPLSVIFK